MKGGARRVARGRTRAELPPATDGVPLERLAKAKTKPQGVSDVRWRIELRRRAACRRARLSGDGVETGWHVPFARDPDRLR